MAVYSQTAGGGASAGRLSLPWIIAASAIASLLLVRILAASPFGRTVRMIREGDRLPAALARTCCCSRWK